MNLEQLKAAADIVYASMQPTPQYCWPLLSEHLGAEVWVKHENYAPTGAFKVRGGLVYFAKHAQTGELDNGVVSATRGNHGQSIGLAARKHGVAATIVVPKGNSVEKNAAMRALGVELLEHGDDFQESREKARELASERNSHMIPSFHADLVAGVASYALELLTSTSNIDTVYVPIGLGSGICGMIAARDALGLNTKIVGVVSAHATAYLDSFTSKSLTESPVTTRLADGMACRTPEQSALDIIYAGVDRIVAVSDAEIADAMQLMFKATHNTCEGAGAAALAAAKQEQNKMAGRKIAVVASGGNIDTEVFSSVLCGQFKGA